MEAGMYDDDLDARGRGLLRRLLGAALSVILVSGYIVLGAATLAVVLFGLAADAWRRLLRGSPRDANTPGAEAA
jgi:hypothetical protein